MHFLCLSSLFFERKSIGTAKEYIENVMMAIGETKNLFHWVFKY